MAPEDSDVFEEAPGPHDLVGDVKRHLDAMADRIVQAEARVKELTAAVRAANELAVRYKHIAEDVMAAWQRDADYAKKRDEMMEAVGAKLQQLLKS